MPQPKGVPLTFRPSGITDTIDATNAPQGSMALLRNLIPDNTTPNCWVPRPASIAGIVLIDPTAIITGELVVGDRVYLMASTGSNPGFDEPFVYDVSAGAVAASLVSVNGITTSNVPASPPPTGDWVPPILAQVGGRILVCHPGFEVTTSKFGWFDISGFTETVSGDLTLASPIITGNPSIIGVQPGMTVTGTGVPVGATVVATTDVITIASADIAGGGPTAALTNVTNSSKGLVDVAVGQLVQGPFIPAGTTVSAVNNPNDGDIQISATIEISADTTIAVTFTGTTIVMDANATVTGTQSLTIAGGTRDAPLWGSGDCDRSPLPSIPLGVAQFYGRAYFADGLDGIPFSDSGFPCRRSEPTQALTTNDGLSVTAIAPLMLSAPLTGGIVQSLIAFEGATKMQQIAGDPSLGNLSMNALPSATGTLAPLSIALCNLGTSFISPQGMRIIKFDGSVTDPIGQGGKGICDPFVLAVYPSRICAAANADTIRATVHGANDPTSASQEYWLNLTRSVWSGPHTFPAALIQPWRNTFLLVPEAVPGSVFQGDAYQSVSSTYVENGTQLAWSFLPSLLPDGADMSMHAMVNASIAIQLAAGTVATITALDENGETIDQVEIGPLGIGSLYGSAVYGSSLFGGQATNYQQRPLDWTIPLVFKQMTLLVEGESAYNVRVSNIYMRYQILNYNLREPSYARP